MKKTYKVTVLIGTVYETEIEAEGLDEAADLAFTRDPRGEGWQEVEGDRTLIIEHHHGHTAFGFGVETARLGVTSLPVGFVGK